LRVSRMQQTSYSGRCQCVGAGACHIPSPQYLPFMFRTLLSGLLLLAFAAEASAQTTPPPAPASVRHTTQQTTTKRTASNPRRTTVRKTSTQKVGIGTPSQRTGAVVRTRPVADAPNPASGKGQGVYAAPGEPVDIQNGATMGYDGAAPRRTKAKTTTTLTPTPR
jgi:cytoskeletal protein RodZ